MVLGSRGSAWRCLLVQTSGTAAMLAVSELLRSATRAVGLTHPWDIPAELDTLRLDGALVGVAVCVLQCSVLWAWLALTATVVEAWRGRVRAQRRAWHLPDGLRRMVLTCCGVALATGIAAPALAGPDLGQRDRHLPALLTGLPLPSRAAVVGRGEPEAGPARPTRPAIEAQRVARSRSDDGPGRPHAVRPPRHRPSGDVRRSRGLAAQGTTVVVAAGDSLWSIAARDLGSGATDSEIAVRWQAIYAANRAVVGPDPDVLEPGQRLTVPRKDPS